MTTLEQMLSRWLTQPWVARAGWTLLHFLWQGTVIAVLFAAVRGIAGRALSAQSRYLLACAALALMAAAPFATFVALGRLDADGAPGPVWHLPAALEWQRALPWLVLVWLCGVAVLSARLIAGLRMTVRLRSVETASVPVEWRQTLHRMMARVRVSQPVRLLASSLVAVPTVVGWLRPVILMPASALTGLGIPQLEALLAHELAHIRRHDYLINILQSVAEAVLFFHPAVWWLSDQIRHEREVCCDDIAVAASGDVVVYTMALADLESHRQARLAMSLAANGGSVLNRIRRLAGKTQPVADSLPGSGAAWALSLLWLLGIGAMTLYGSPVNSPTPVPSNTAVVAALPPLPAKKNDRPLLAQAISHIAASAILFDPLMDAPQTPQTPQTGAAPAPVVDQEPIHVEGTVVGGAHEPLKKATVRLEAIVSNGQASAYSETTDDTGKFAIKDIAPGTYRLSANRTGFVAGQYGARSPGAPGATIVLAAGATLKDLEIPLTPQGTIAGRITDQDGDPVARAPVTILRSGYEHGKKQLQGAPNMRAQTDDTGRFRIGNVPPGRYYLKADQNNQPPDLEPGVADMATYYPGAPDPSGAAPVEVLAGARIEGINIRLRRAHVFSVKGSVLLDGAPVNTLLEKRRTGDDSSQIGGGLSVQNGVLSLSYVEPGSYSLAVLPSGSVATGLPFSLGLSGHLDFTVKDSNLEGVVMKLERGVELKGAFKLDGGDWQDLFPQPGAPVSAAAAPAIQAAAAQATSQPTSQPRLPFVGLASVDNPRPTPPTRINADGTFQLKPAALGRYLIDITSLPPGIYVESVRYGTLDVTNAPINVIAGGGDLEIVLSAKAASISGALTSSTGDPMYGVRVTAWPQHPNLGTVTGGIVSATTSQNGSFTFAGLAPGIYHVAAWEEIDAGLTADANFLDLFTGRATTVTVDANGQKSADVKLIPADAVAREAARLPQ